MRDDQDEADSGDLEIVRRFASDSKNWDAFATLLAEVLPQYVQLRWYEDVPYKRYFKTWQSAGFTILPNHYYSPVPDLSTIDPRALTDRIPLFGIDMDDETQLTLLKSLKQFLPEYADFANRTELLTDGRWSLGGPFARPDADAAYALVRHLRPKRVIEIGTGYSTLAMSEACVKNASEGHQVEFVSIDPYPSHITDWNPPGLGKQIVSRVQDMPLEFFASLSEDDILFIDSTHVLKQGSDVEYEFLRIIPNVGKGTWIHVHDIMLPLPYFSNWLTNEHIFWNEQQLLTSFLAFNGDFKPTLALSYLLDKFESQVRDTFPGLQEKCSPGSFWFKRL